MVVNMAQAESVLFAGGRARRAAPGALVVLMATCPPAAVVALGERVTQAGCALVDAPVSGGVVGRHQGDADHHGGRAQGHVREGEAGAGALGDKVFHVGETLGQGATVKTVNQLLCGVHIAACAEALALAERAGIEGAVALKILGGAAASSWMLNDRGPRMLESDPVVSSAVDIFVKDLGIVLDAGRSAKVTTPLAALAHQMFLAASAKGLGARTTARSCRSIAALAGSKPN